MNNCKKGKEEIKTKLDKGIFKTCAKPNTATATWWKNFPLADPAVRRTGDRRPLPIFFSYFFSAKIRKKYFY
jgi:hypothetical protein